MPINQTMQPEKFAQDIIAIAQKSNPHFKDMSAEDKESMKSYWREVGKVIKDYVSSAKITAICDKKPVIFENIE